MDNTTGEEENCTFFIETLMAVHCSSEEETSNVLQTASLFFELIITTFHSAVERMKNKVAE